MKAAYDRAHKIFEDGNGYARTRELTAGGVHTSQIRELQDEGYIYEIKRGLYQWSDYIIESNQELVEVSKIVPNGVICLLSALSYHGLTTHQPRENYVAIHRDATRHTLPDYPPIRLFYFSDSQYRVGITETTLSGHQVKIYDAEKTLCDVVRYRNKIGQDIVRESLKEYFDQPNVNVEKLMDYARKTGVFSIISQYMEVLP